MLDTKYALEVSHILFSFSTVPSRDSHNCRSKPDLKLNNRKPKTYDLIKSRLPRQKLPYLRIAPPLPLLRPPNLRLKHHVTFNIEYHNGRLYLLQDH
jgi:hypothetical protein